MISKNLTPFYWGPKSTSRQPPQVEMAMCLRGVFHLRPGQPLEPITDEIDQGFMSGDTYDPEDMDKTGPLVHCNDFSDWKPNTDLLLKGTAYAPKGRDVVCDVAWGVAEWSKTLRVFGPRVFKPGLLFGGSVGDPEPFSSLPLTWENAYGGEGYALNPVGKGYTGDLLPQVEDPNAPVTKVGAKRVAPASFLPISPMWPQRWKKVGKNYGKSWEKNRAPFVSDDFDWSHYNAAPADQQLVGRYLRGDETVWFQNLHPEHPRFEVKLPALRMRGLVKTDDDVVREVKFNLDTLYADLDAGRLTLTWRALTPIRELDQTDVKVVLIASENLADAPLPATHYQQLLEEFEDDPVGLKTKMPEGFLELAEALEAADKAELTGAPKPDFKKLAAKFPVGGLIPPWLVVAAGSLDDPLKAAPGILAAQEKPLLPGLDIKELVTKLQAAKGDPGQAAAELEAMAEGKPPETKGPLLQIANGLRQADAAEKLKAEQQLQSDPALALEKTAALLPPEQGEKLKAAAAKVRASLADAKAKAAAQPALPPKPAKPKPAKGAVAKIAEAQAMIAAQAPKSDKIEVPDLPDLNAELKSALLPLNDVKVPEKLIDVDGMLAEQIANLDKQEAGYRKRFGDHPLMALFALSKGKILMAGRKLAAKTPDTSALDGLDKASAALQAQGIDEEATAPLVDLKERLATALKSLPGVEDKPEQRDYAYLELPGEDLSDQDLSGKSFACAKLAGADLSGCVLVGCDFRKADLTGANLTNADLRGANLTNLVGADARFGGADLTQAVFQDADLTAADFVGANLAGANLSGATIDQATLSGVSLVGAQMVDTSLMSADLSGADLTEANLESARGLRANLAGAKLVRACLKFADLNKGDLTGADFSGADMALGTFNLIKGNGLILNGACIDVAKFENSLLIRADLRGVFGTMGSFSGCDMTEADLRGANLSRYNLSSAVLKNTKAEQAHLERIDFRDVVAEGASFADSDLAGSSATGEAAFRGCDFKRSKGYRSFWFDAELSGSDFSYASMRNAYFQGAKGNQVNFFAADLKEASFRKATLSNSRFVRADMCHVDLCESELERVQFTSANCFETKFLDAKLAECDFLETTLYRARFDRAEGAPR